MKLVAASAVLVACGDERARVGAAVPGDLFEAPSPWQKSVEGMSKSGASDTIMGWLAANGGWGTGIMRVDFSMEVLVADESTPDQEFVPTDDFYTPDCEHVPFPIPAGGALEGEEGYACENDGDCHLLVVHGPRKKLYEMWRANIDGDTFYGGCAVTWDLTKEYPANLRGEGCSSADAGGFPIAPMLFSADEVAEGSIDHAIRFILPNNRIRAGEYVPPSTHSTLSTSGGRDAPPYGIRLRLRADYPMDNLPSDGARVVARAMQKYGMLLADAGSIALTAQSDRFTSHTWSELGMDSYSLEALEVGDFEVVDFGEPVPWESHCTPNWH